ncbi:MAG: PadR family transcriptional regulator, partial [Ilumatobacteraceae bacterium]
FTPTDEGRSELRRWLDAPVAHLRDLRSELLLKLVLARLNGVRTTALVRRQREVVARMVAVTDAAIIETPDDVVALWRAESARAAQRFLESLPS